MMAGGKEDDESKRVAWIEERVNTGRTADSSSAARSPASARSISFQYPFRVGKGMWASNQIYLPNSLRELVAHAGGTRDLGDIRINPSPAVAAFKKPANLLCR